jgi:hypothetical protein
VAMLSSPLRGPEAGLSKRTRGSRRAGQRRAGGRHAGRSGRPGHQRPGSVNRASYRPSDLAVAPEIAEELVAEGAEESPDVAARAARMAAPRSRARPSSLLAAKAATEYIYVAQDVRRIVAVAGLLFGIMFALWLLIVVLKVISL